MFVCGLFQISSAASLNGLVYVDDGSSITITGHEYSIRDAVVIPSSIDGKPVTAIGNQAFYYAKSMKSLSIPSTVTRIGEYAFSLCYDLKSVNIPDGVTEIRAGTFNDCRSLQSISLPEGITRLGFAAFGGCRELARVSLPEGINRIPVSLFHGCLGLERISFPSKISVIGDHAFAFCGKLNHVTIPKTVVRIGNFAFDSCSTLSRVTIPAKVRDIGRGAFSNCGRLQRAVFLGDAPVMGGHVFKYRVPEFKIFVSETSKGFTYPTWQGCRISRPAPEIAIATRELGNLSTGESRVQFGSTLVGGTGRKVTFTITNFGTRKLEHLSVRKGNPNDGDYVITDLPPESLAPGKTGRFSVVFTPKNSGKRTARILIASSDEDEDPFEIQLKGVGLVFIN